MSHRAWFTLAVITCLAFGAVRGWGQSSETAEGLDVQPNATEGCRALGRYLVERCPSVCHRPVHWILGVDISASGKWGWIETTRHLVSDWLQHVVVVGDRLTLVVFDSEVRTLGPWEVEDRSVVLNEALDQVRVREGAPPGTALDTARQRVLELAAAASRAEAGQVVFTLLIADRSDPDAMPHASHSIHKELWDRYGPQFAPSEEGTTSQVVEGTTQLNVVQPDGQKVAHLIVFHSMARRASQIPVRADWPIRCIPATTIIPPPLPPSPGPRPAVRRLFKVVEAVVVVFLIGLIIWLWKAVGGQLINKDTGKHEGLLWRPFRRDPVKIRATVLAQDFPLTPLHEGLDNPVVAYAYLHPSWWPFKPWEVSLQTREGYWIGRRGEAAWGDNLSLKAEEGEQVLVVKDKAREVAQGRVAFQQKRLTRQAWGAFFAFAVFLLVWFVADFFVLLSLPGPTPASIVTPQPEPLCSQE